VRKAKNLFSGKRRSWRRTRKRKENTTAPSRRQGGGQGALHLQAVKTGLVYEKRWRRPFGGIGKIGLRAEKDA